MGADQRAAVTADTVCRIPDRYVVSYTTFFILCCSDRHHAVRIFAEGADREIIAFRPVHGDQNLTDVFRQAFIHTALLILQGGPAFGNVDLYGIRQAAFNGGEVHVHNLLTLAGEGLDGGILHVLLRLLNRQNAREFEKGCLQHGAGPVAEADLLRNACGIDGVEVHLALR